MMDERSKRELMRLQEKMNREHKPGDMQRTVIDREQEEKVNDLLRNGNLEPHTRRVLEDMKRQGAFREERQETDYKKAKEFDEELTREVNRAMKDGRIKKMDLKWMDKL